ncbi:LCP family protein [Frankia sp. CcWB2]
MSPDTMRPPALPPALDPRGPRRHHSPLRRLSVGAVALLSVLVLGLSTIGWAAYRQFDKAVTRVDWDIEGARPASVDGEENILLLGDDSREGTEGQYGVVDGVRSDTTIIAHFGKDGSATLLSFPRDMLVPEVPREKATARDGRSKLTEVLELADVPGLVSTLESLTGLKIDHTISINLAGFKAMTDAVGGVTVCVTPLPNGSTRNLHDSMSGWSGRLGENRLNGDQALAFVRTRYALGDERLRILRQQQFLSKLLATATSTGVLTNPAKITSLIGAVGGALRIDQGLDQTAILKLAKRASELGPGRIHFVTVPTHIALRSDGAVDDMGSIPPHGAVLIVDQAGLDQVLAPLLPAGTKPPAQRTLDPAQVSIAAVRNASGRAGLATRTVDGLRALGFTGPMTAATSTRQTLTEVRHPPGQEAAARTLAATIPGSRIVAGAGRSGAGLVLVLGSTFTGLSNVGLPNGGLPSGGLPSGGLPGGGLPGAAATVDTRIPTTSTAAGGDTRTTTVAITATPAPATGGAGTTGVTGATGTGGTTGTATAPVGPVPSDTLCTP